MEKRKVKYVNMWEGFSQENNAFLKIMSKYYDIVVDNENPDYIICSSFRNSADRLFEFCNYSAVRIYISMENFEPNYNLFDYTLTTSYAQNLDRSFRVPTYLMDILLNNYKGTTHENFNAEMMKKKTRFCNLIFGHERDDGLRKKLAEELSSYKKVDSAGIYFNNMPNGTIVEPKDKMNFQMNYKFSIVLESTDQPGFATEKIWDAYKAYTIPIYCGDTMICNEVNEKAFIDIRNYDSMESLKEYIKYLDKNDEEFCRIIQQPFFSEKGYEEKRIRECEAFFKNIFEQEPRKAYRRPLGPRNGLIIAEENILRRINQLDRMHVWGILSRLIRK